MCPNFYSEETPCGSILGSDHLLSLTTAKEVLYGCAHDRMSFPRPVTSTLDPNLPGDIALLHTVNTR